MTIYQVRTEFTGTQGGPFLNTLYFGTVGGTAQQAVTAAGTFWGAVDADMANNLTWATLAEVDTLNEVTGALLATDVTTPVTGTGADASNQAAFATQGLIRLSTDEIQNGRRVRGRIFVPGMTTANEAEGLLDAAVITSWNTAIAALIADATSTLNVWHRPVNGAGGAQATVTGGSTSNQFAILRSRRD